MAKVLDFVSKRKEKVESKRRDFERLWFKNFLGSYSVIDGAEGLYKIQLIDISENGCLFQIPHDGKEGQQFLKGSELNLRMYFTQKAYIPIIVQIVYGKEHVDDAGGVHMQYGCEFDQEIHSYEALKSFVDFVYKFADLSVEDKGESREIFFL